ncbi:MAG: SPFH domain-containing protein [Acholeplasmataceae bacterium]
MDGIIIALLIIGGLFFIVAAFSFRLVTQTNKYVIERLGGYLTTWGVGLHFLVPFIDRVAAVVTLKEQVRDFDPQPVITKDNVTMQIDTVVFFQITDPKLYAYGVENPLAGIENLSATTLRNIIGDLDLDQTLTSRDLINTQMRSILDEATDPWGIKVNRVELKNILPPKDIRDAMEKQMRAEREKRQTILIAEGDKRSQILRAEGEAEAIILRAEANKKQNIREAEGQAEGLLRLKEAEAKGIELVKEAEADSAVIKLKTLDALAKVADGRSTKIIIPSNITDLASTVMAATEVATAKEETPTETT